jgi:hypothetical protein
VAADYEYFVSSPAQLASLDLAKSPLSQLPAERAAEIPGVDPAVVLLGLVEVLSTQRHRPTNDLAYDGGESGPWVTAVDAFVVEAIRGADGDPEMEWEDAVEQWSKLVDDELEDPDVLLETTDELRRLCGEVEGETRLYCWTAR